MVWKLNDVKDIERTIDDSGVYVIVSRIAENQHSKGYFHTAVRIRVDIMLTGGDIALQSFIGEANAVRKAAIKWLWNTVNPKFDVDISTEHASYIGYEIARAMLDEHYEQS